MEQLGNIDSIGVNLSIDVTKLDKSRFVAGKNGAKYCDLTVFLSPEENEYGSNGGIVLAQSKNEREQKERKTFVGNSKIFYVKDKKMDFLSAPPKRVKKQVVEEFDDDIPF
mgnify:FL=1